MISNAGWLIPRKRFDVFIETAAIIKRTLPDVCFVIAGDGSEKDALHELAIAQGLEKEIKWLGWQENMDLVYRATDLVLFNTDWDAVARTPIEAGVRGINIICSELNGGLHDLFDDPSWILPSHDLNALAQLVLELLPDQEKRENQIRVN